MNDKTSTRTIHTGLYGDYAREILDAVHGQLSDGYFENRRGYDKYWTNFNVVVEVDGEITFHVNADSYTRYCNCYLDNPFCRMKDAEFLAWYASKLKAVIRSEAKDNNWKKGWWKRDNTENKSIYLNYHLDITVADIYCVYDQLLGRIQRCPRLTVERVFGARRNDAEIAEEAAKRDKVAAINLEYKRFCDGVSAKEKAEVEAVQAKWREVRQAEYKNYVERLKAVGGSL